MRFTYENVSYLIEFERQPRLITPRWTDPETGEEHDAVVDKQKPVTTATIYTLTETNDPKKPIKTVFRTFAVGTYYKDQNNLDKGRKEALRLALYDAPVVRPEDSHKTGPIEKPVVGKLLSRDFRIAVWTAYFSRTPMSKAMFEKSLRAEVE